MAMVDGRAQWALAALPCRVVPVVTAIRGRCQFIDDTLQHHAEGGKLFCGRLPGGDHEKRVCGIRPGIRSSPRSRPRGDSSVIVTHGVILTHRGMFPCFFAGRLARFVFSARSAFTTATLVAAGSITPSSSPRSAARNGLATL
jgi:hypothetical protein